MRSVNAAGLALLGRIYAGEQGSITQLVHVNFTPIPAYLTTAGHRVRWNGLDWLPGVLGAIQPISDSNTEFMALKFTLPGISPEQVFIALEAQVEGIGIRVYDALVNPTSGVCEEAILAWSGTLNVPELINSTQADLTVSAEHRGLIANRPKPSRYTDDEQRRLYPGDSSMDGDPLTDAKPLAWPNATFFRQ